MNMRDTLNELNELYEEKLQEDTDQDQKWYDCADEAYSILCENAMDEVEQYLYNVETGDLEFSDRTRKYIEKQTEKYPDSAVEHDIVETAIRRVLKLAREAFVYGNF